MKKILGLSIMTLLLVVMLALGVNAERGITASGTCGAQGNNLTWTLYSDGELVIEGEGDMWDWTYASMWVDYRANITKVTIGDNVTSICEGVFADCDSLTSITVSANNTEYSNDEYGVLFNKDKTQLIQYPIGNARMAYDIPDSVESIGDRAFYYCTSLTNIDIPDSVTSIGDWAFRDCDSLASVTIGNCVESIGVDAFASCDSLTSIYIPNNVTSIGIYAFAYCDSLTSITVDTDNAAYSSDEFGVLFNKDKTELIQYPIGNSRDNYTIPSSATSIGNSAFRSCDSLTSIYIPNSVTSIGERAFNGCVNLTSVTIGNSVTSIGDNAFHYCTSLTSIDIPDSVTSIGDWAFCDCDSLTSITIPDSVTSIGGYAFANCDSLTSIDIPGSVTSIGNYAFLGCTSLKKATIYTRTATFGSNVFSQTPSDFEIHGYTGSTAQTYAEANNHKFVPMGECGDNLTWTLYSDGELVIEGTGDMWDWNEGRSPWNANRANIKKVTIGSGVTSIGDWAFYKCTSLTSIDIPDGVTSIGNWAFAYCSSLTSITVSTSNTAYSNDEYGVLFNKDKTQLIQYPIGNARMAYDIPDSVTSIGDYAFVSCTSLTSIEIPDSVTSIGDYAFVSCTNLTSIEIPDSVTSIGDLAFNGCLALTTIDIPDSVETIGKNAFVYCVNLENVYLGSGVIDIGDNTFLLCDKLNAIIVDESNEYYSNDEYGVLFDKDKTTLVVYPYGKPGTTYTIPVSVTSIGNSAFQNCTSLTSIDIPDSVTSIGNSAFYNCTNLKTATINSLNSTFGTGVFANTHVNFEIYGHIGSTAEEYAKANNYKFAAISQIETGKCGDNVTYTLYNNCELVIEGEGDMWDWESFTACPWFDYQTSIRNVTIDDGVTSIGYHAFENCQNLTAIDIPSTVTSIGYFAFHLCTSLESIDIPSSVTSIGNYAFDMCDSLTSITVSANNTEYSNDEYGVLFNKDKTQLIQYPVGNARVAYDIPDSVTSIGDYAFAHCTSLASIDIPSSVTSMGVGAFRGCTNLESIDIPSSVTSIGDHAFADCDSLTSITVSTSNTAYSNDEYGVLFNKDKTQLIQYPIGNARVTYDIPSSVTDIGELAFSGCESLTSIDIPDSVTSIGASAFRGCTSLANIDIPDSVTNIGDLAFEYCHNLKKATIYSRNATIGWDVFFRAYADFEIHGYTGSTAEEYAEANNHKFVPIDIASGKCGDNITWTLYSDGELVIEGEGDMWDWTSVSEVTWYSYCANITKVTIGNSVTSIGNSAFVLCTNLTIVDIPDSVTSIGDRAFESCSSLASVTIGNGVTSIGDSAFGGCTSLTSIDIPDSVTYIGNAAFGGCDSLTSIDIPDSVISIGNFAFAYCGNLTKAVIYSRTATFGTDVFYNTPSDFEIHGYAGSTAGAYAKNNYYEFVALRIQVGDKYCDTLEEAIADAKKGDTVKLFADCEEPMVIARGGITLDLNGHKLTADYFAAFEDNNVVDGSADKSGLLIVPAKCLVLSKNNAQMPVYSAEEGGYRFATMKMTQYKIDSQGDDFVKIKFRPAFGTESVTNAMFGGLLANGGQSCDVEILIRVTWPKSDGTIGNASFVYNDDFVKEAYVNGKTFTITITGLNAEAYGGLEAVFVVRSLSTNVEMASRVMYTYNP